MDPREKKARDKERQANATCNNCGRKGHMSRECSRGGGQQQQCICYECGENGHMSRECPQKPKVLCAYFHSNARVRVRACVQNCALVLTARGSPDINAEKEKRDLERSEWVQQCALKKVRRLPDPSGGVPSRPNVFAALKSARLPGEAAPAAAQGETVAGSGPVAGRGPSGPKPAASKEFGALLGYGSGSSSSSDDDSDD